MEAITKRYNDYLKMVFNEQFTGYCDEAGIPKKFTSPSENPLLRRNPIGAPL